MDIRALNLSRIGFFPALNEKLVCICTAMYKMQLQLWWPLLELARLLSNGMWFIPLPDFDEVIPFHTITSIGCKYIFRISDSDGLARPSSSKQRKVVQETIATISTLQCIWSNEVKCHSTHFIDLMKCEFCSASMWCCWLCFKCQVLRFFPNRLTGDSKRIDRFCTPSRFCAICNYWLTVLFLWRWHLSIASL